MRRVEGAFVVVLHFVLRSELDVSTYRSGLPDMGRKIAGGRSTVPNTQPVPPTTRWQLRIIISQVTFKIDAGTHVGTRRSSRARGVSVAPRFASVSRHHKTNAPPSTAASVDATARYSGFEAA